MVSGLCTDSAHEVIFQDDWIKLRVRSARRCRDAGGDERGRCRPERCLNQPVKMLFTTCPVIIRNPGGHPRTLAFGIHSMAQRCIKLIAVSFSLD